MRELITKLGNCRLHPMRILEKGVKVGPTPQFPPVLECLALNSYEVADET